MYIPGLLAGPPIDNTYGETVESDKAHEDISKAVASLPPEQMFELMKQMKLCIQVIILFGLEFRIYYFIENLYLLFL